MAVDSRDKRFSIMGLGSTTLNVLPNPDGTIGNADKLQLLSLYASRTSFQTNVAIFIDDVDKTDKVLWQNFSLTDSMGNIKGLTVKIKE